jgi:DnaJ domain
MKNRRNYYRILHVQPDAPLPVIKSSYTALMFKMKQHPDLGGDHDACALINEAYAVLADPAKRADYDRWLQSRSRGSAEKTTGQRPWQANPATARGTAPQQAAPRTGGSCLFCQAPIKVVSTPERCHRCGSPTSPPPGRRAEGDDHRAAPRVARGGEVKLLLRGATTPRRALIHDLSPAGVSVVAAQTIAVDDVIRVDGAMLCAVGRVASCREQRTLTSRRFSIGIEFLSVEFAAASGTLISTRA